LLRLILALNCCGGGRFVDTRTDLDWDQYCEEYEAPKAGEAKKLKRNHTILFTEGVGSGASFSGAASSGAGASGGAAAAPPPAKKAKNTPKPPKTAGSAVWSWQSAGSGTKASWSPYSPSDSEIIERAWEVQGAGEPWILAFIRLFQNVQNVWEK
jgi:hypothetical protein